MKIRTLTLLAAIDNGGCAFVASPSLVARLFIGATLPRSGITLVPIGGFALLSLGGECPPGAEAVSLQVIPGLFAEMK